MNIFYSCVLYTQRGAGNAGFGMGAVFCQPLRTESESSCNMDKRAIKLSIGYFKNLLMIVWAWAWGCCFLIHVPETHGSMCKFLKYGHLLLTFWQLFANHLSLSTIWEENAHSSPPSQNFFSRKQSVRIFRKNDHISKSYSVYYVCLPNGYCKQGQSFILPLVCGRSNGGSQKDMSTY